MKKLTSRQLNRLIERADSITGDNDSKQYHIIKAVKRTNTTIHIEYVIQYNVLCKIIIRKSKWYHDQQMFGFHCDFGPAVKVKDYKLQNFYNLWYLNGVDITDSVKHWMELNNISRPMNRADKILFKLKYV